MMTPTLIIITKHLISEIVDKLKSDSLCEFARIFLQNFFYSRTRLYFRVLASSNSTSAVFTQFLIELINVKATVAAAVAESSRVVHIILVYDKNVLKSQSFKINHRYT